MAFKTLEFELYPVDDEISLEVEYCYHHDPGRNSGPPEDCYFADTKCEIWLADKRWVKTVMDHYEAIGREAIKAIEAKVEELRRDMAPAEWVQDDHEGFEVERELERQSDYMGRGM